jgi:putative ABC transport system permease protein
MALLRQTLVLSRLSLSTLRQRLATSLTILLSMAVVTGVLISTLSVTAGINREYRAGTADNLAIVLPAKNPFEASGGLARGEIGTILDAPGIARDAKGQLLGDAELSFYVEPARHVFSGGALKIRGMSAAGLALRAPLTIVAGRMFESGRKELVIGTSAQRGFGLKVGDSVIMQDGTWPIVGAFAADGVMGDELFGDADTLATLITHQSSLGSVHVRLEDAARFAAFQRWLTTNPALHVAVQTQLDYNGRLAADQSQYFTAMAFFAGAIMSIGALFGSVNILYGVVSARTREMAILRGMGYEAVAVAGSIVFEALSLSVGGALLGGAMAWMLFDGREVMKNEIVYRCVVSPQLILLGVAWVLLLGLLGSIFPAIRAGRLEVIAAMRGV